MTGTILPTIFGPNKYLASNVDCTGFNTHEHYALYPLFSAEITVNLDVLTNFRETSCKPVQLFPSYVIRTDCWHMHSAAVQLTLRNDMSEC